MSRRLSEIVTKYVGNGKFELQHVPLPPGVKRVTRLVNGAMVSFAYITLGCPHCHEDIEFGWEFTKISNGITRELMEVLLDIRHRLSLLPARNDVMMRLIDLIEELLKELKNR